MWYAENDDGTHRKVDIMQEGDVWKRVARHFLRPPGESCTIDVSTVFLGLDHDAFGAGPPVLYETMIFGGAYDQYQMRYCTRAEATSEHEKIVSRLAAGLSPDEGTMRHGEEEQDSTADDRRDQALRNAPARDRVVPEDGP